MPRVVIPPPYRGPTDGAAELEVEATKVRGCLEAVERKHPGFLALMLDDDGQLRRFATLFLNGDKLTKDVLAQPVTAGDSLEIISSVAGG